MQKSTGDVTWITETSVVSQWYYYQSAKINGGTSEHDLNADQTTMDTLCCRWCHLKWELLCDLKGQCQKKILREYISKMLCTYVNASVLRGFIFKYGVSHLWFFSNFKLKTVWQPARAICNDYRWVTEVVYASCRATPFQLLELQSAWCAESPVVSCLELVCFLVGKEEKAMRFLLHGGESWGFPHFLHSCLKKRKRWGFCFTGEKAEEFPTLV